MPDDYLWDPRADPDLEVVRLEALLRPVAYRPAPLREGAIVAQRLRFTRASSWMALAAGVVLAAGALYSVGRTPATPWTVTASKGIPVVLRATRLPADRSPDRALAKGDVLETDARSVAVLAVGRIGRAELGPGSRLRLLDDGVAEHRLALERGTMHASIDAPPRFFLVETASALAVDLGCIYTLTVDEWGSGLLTVEEGEVELQLGDVRTSVLAGNAAALHAGSGPGLPYPVHASDALRRAVAAYDAHPASLATIDAVIGAADARSTITLWHLLQRTGPAARARVFARLAAIAPPPASVTRERVLRGESGALQRWRTDLQPAWALEPPVWRRAWNAVRR